MKVILAAVSVLFVAGPAFAQCSDADKKALEAFDRSWGDATNRGDRAALQAIMADDYQGLGPVGTQTKAAGIDAAVRAAERNRANPAAAPRFVYDSYTISCTPNTATITHRGVTTVAVDGKDQTFQSRAVHVLEKRGGRWQVVANTGHPLDDAGVLSYMEREWNDASLRRDASWFERNYASDVSQINSRTAALWNKAQALADVRTDKTVIQSLDLSDLNVRVEGKTAVVTGVNHVVGRDPQGKAFDRRVRFTDVFIKRDGRWQVWATQGTLIP
ncbi:MAG TPA: nuclear transport factor 2 family protein [Gemmatimonadaceae bacterium]|nr:nuclear transport factor 2 family protein [Gemmatimonadaceae bacterium]